MSIKAVFGRYSAAYLIRDGVPIRCDVRDHSGASVLAAGAVTVAPTFTAAAAISPASGPVGTVYTISLGTVTGTQPITLTPALTLNGADVTGQIVNGRYTSTATGALTLTVTASNGTQPNATSEAGATVGATAPAQVSGLIANVQGQDVELIWDAPANGGAAITDYEVVTAASTVTNPAQATALSDTAGDTSTSRNLANIPYSTTRNWWVRAVNSLGAAPWSARSSYAIGADPNAAWNALKAASYFAIDGALLHKSCEGFIS